MLKAYLSTNRRLLDLRDRFAGFRADDSGAALIEYAMIIGLVAVASITALGLLSTDINDAFGRIGVHLGNIQ
jgi:Flp pilus assembly pilin Flp